MVSVHEFHCRVPRLVLQAESPGYRQARVALRDNPWHPSVGDVVSDRQTTGSGGKPDDRVARAPEKAVYGLMLGSMLPLCVVVFSAFASTGGPTDWGAAFLAFFGLLGLAVMLVLAVMRSRRLRSPWARFGVPMLAVAELGVSIVAIFGIREGWWAR